MVAERVSGTSVKYRTRIRLRVPTHWALSAKGAVHVHIGLICQTGRPFPGRVVSVTLPGVYASCVWEMPASRAELRLAMVERDPNSENLALVESQMRDDPVLSQYMAVT